MISTKFIDKKRQIQVYIIENKHNVSFSKNIPDSDKFFDDQEIGKF